MIATAPDDRAPSTLERELADVRPPDHIPPEIFEAAMATFLAGRRLDMQGLAAEIGIGRATLYRKVGTRDVLLGEAIWYLTRRALEPVLEECRTLEGSERVLCMVERFLRFVHDQPAFRRLLEHEPEAALRIFASKRGPVQGRLIELTERLLAEEEAAGNLRPSIDRRTLAYVIVRIGESFLYADVIADDEPDLDEVVELLRRLLDEPSRRTGRFDRRPSQPMQGGEA